MSEMIEDSPSLNHAEAHTLPDGIVPLIYAHKYNITACGLERLHPFDGCKFAKIRKKLIDDGLRSPRHFIKPEALTRDQLLTVHTEEYLKSLSKSSVLSRIFEVAAAAFFPAPLLDASILHPMRLSSGGTLMACELALKKGLAINVGGGYHHAASDSGGGFCVYSDVPIALTILQQSGLLKKALIVDTDAHQGNGFATVLGQTAWGHVLDFYDESIYPYPKVKEDISVPLPARTGGDRYLELLSLNLPEAIDRFKPDLIVHNAGSDVLKSDPLSTLLLTPEDLQERDLTIVSMAREKGIPIAMVLAGGYGHESAAAHSASIKAILQKFDS